MGTADRIAMALGRPFTKKGGSVCRPRLQVRQAGVEGGERAA